MSKDCMLLPKPKKGKTQILRVKAQEIYEQRWVVRGVLSANPIGAVITIVGALIAIFVTLYNKCERFHDGVDKIFGKMKTFLEGIKKWLKGIFDFDWKLPRIKLPHFRLVGEFSLSKMTAPRLSVDWYAKGGILTVWNGGWSM